MSLRGRLPFAWAPGLWWTRDREGVRETGPSAEVMLDVWTCSRGGEDGETVWQHPGKSWTTPGFWQRWGGREDREAIKTAVMKRDRRPGISSDARSIFSRAAAELAPPATICSQTATFGAETLLFLTCHGSGSPPHNCPCPWNPSRTENMRLPAALNSVSMLITG